MLTVKSNGPQHSESQAYLHNANVCTQFIVFSARMMFIKYGCKDIYGVYKLKEKLKNQNKTLPLIPLHTRARVQTHTYTYINL